jgi:hypothetical protein
VEEELMAIVRKQTSIQSAQIRTRMDAITYDKIINTGMLAPIPTPTATAQRTPPPMNQGTIAHAESPFVQESSGKCFWLPLVAGMGSHFPFMTDLGIFTCFETRSVAVPSSGTAAKVFLQAGQSTSVPSYSSGIVSGALQNGHVIFIIALLPFFQFLSIMVFPRRGLMKNLFPCLFLGSSEMGP